MTRWKSLMTMAAMLTIGTASAAAADIEAGKPAPNFSAQDASGKTRSLSEFNGKFVVLEWFNPDCPFSKKQYDSGTIQQLQKQSTDKGVVWLTIDSSAPGKQGHLTGEQAQAVIAERKASPTAVLLDPDGAVGKLYGAKTTPHMFVIDPKGVVIYHGAIDDQPTLDAAAAKNAHNYVQTALDEAMAGKPVTVKPTQPYGCSVKYQ